MMKPQAKSQALLLKAAMVTDNVLKRGLTKRWTEELEKLSSQLWEHLTSLPNITDVEETVRITGSTRSTSPSRRARRK